MEEQQQPVLESAKKVNVGSILESLLFVSDKPISISRFQEVLGEEISKEQIEETLKEIILKYSQELFGIELREAQGGFHFTTKIANSEWVRRFLQTKPFRLGKSAMETLAIVAYREPVTRAEIDKVRGIDSSHLMRTLIERGLVKMVGKADIPGRPVQYATTERFLEVTGLRSLQDLPPLSELDELQGHQKDKVATVEERLDEVFESKMTFEESMEVQSEELQKIDEILAPIKPSSEIYESQTHAEVAQENELALAGFLDFWKPMRKSRKSNSNPEPVETAILN